MSAWIVSAHHIDALVEAACRTSRYGTTLRYFHQGDCYECRDPTEVGEMLLAECVKSVAYRYSDTRDEDLPGWSVRPETYRFRTPRVFKPEELLNALDSYEYQSCEHPDWRESQAFAFCQALRDRLIGELPAYRAATTWDIEEDDSRPYPLPSSVPVDR